MAKRDPETTARNKIDTQMSLELKQLLPFVLSDTNIVSELSLHGMIGHKNEHYIDVRNEIIYSQDEYVGLWLDGLIHHIEELPKRFRTPENSHYAIYNYIKTSKNFEEYLYIFLKRTYLRNANALSKKRPTIDDAEIWIGENNANYGILVTPRFKGNNWENDKSEIRHFGKKYWSIGHVLQTGLLVPFKNKKFEFSSIEEYLNFFENVIVRNSGSPYELKIAEKYSDFVLKHKTPEDIPLLIPEYRYDGLINKHKHRLDFTIIQYGELTKIGFELSPWSTHGQLKKLDNKTTKEINAEALLNFEKEIIKLRNYFNKFGIYTLIYSDSDLANIDSVFEDIKKFLEPQQLGRQIKFQIFEKITNSNL